MPSAIPCSLSPLICRIYSCYFTDWRQTISSIFLDLQIPLIFTEEFVLSRHAHCAFSRLRCYGHSLLLSSYFSRIDRIENLLCSACGHPSQSTSHIILHCTATDSASRALWRLSISLTPVVQALGSFPVSGAPWFSAISLGRSRVATT